MQDEKKRHRAWSMEHGDKRQPPSPHGFGVPRRAEDRRQRTKGGLERSGDGVILRRGEKGGN